jgi:hypothetical protein
MSKSNPETIPNTLKDSILKVTESKDIKKKTEINSNQ